MPRKHPLLREEPKDRTYLLARDIISDLTDLLNDWENLEEASYAKAQRPTEDYGKHSPKRPPISQSDPTGSLAVSNAGARAELEMFRKSFHKAAMRFWNDLHPAYKRLHRAARLLDRPYERTDNRISAGDAG